MFKYVQYTNVCPTMLTTLAKPLERADEECNQEIERRRQIKEHHRELRLKSTRINEVYDMYMI